MFSLLVGKTVICVPVQSAALFLSPFSAPLSTRSGLLTERLYAPLRSPLASLSHPSTHTLLLYNAISPVQFIAHYLEPS